MNLAGSTLDRRLTWPALRPTCTSVVQEKMAWLVCMKFFLVAQRMPDDENLSEALGFRNA